VLLPSIEASTGGFSKAPNQRDQRANGRFFANDAVLLGSATTAGDSGRSQSLSVGGDAGFVAPRFLVALNDLYQQQMPSQRNVVDAYTTDDE